MFTVRKIFHSTPCLQLLHGCLDVNYISFIGAASLSIKIKSVKIKYDCFKNCCCWWIFQFLVYPSFKSNFLDKGEISQRLLDGSPYSCVQTFMAPRCRILIIVVIPWLFIQFLQQVKRVTYKWYINCNIYWQAFMSPSRRIASVGNLLMFHLPSGQHFKKTWIYTKFFSPMDPITQKPFSYNVVLRTRSSNAGIMISCCVSS